jgi:uncharacterized protein with NAD-binding domain and iron-sulfur cluster
LSEPFIPVQDGIAALTQRLDDVILPIRVGRPGWAAIPLFSALRLLRTLDLAGRLSPLYLALVMGVLEGCAMVARRVVEAVGEGNHAARRLWQLIDLTIANLCGIFRDGLLSDPRGLAVIEDLDYVEWLRRNGASALALENAVLRGLYNLAFAYRQGHPGRPQFAASDGLRLILRLFFAYKGAIFWKMQAGMGDVVFAPLYELLRSRGVRFRFFHDVRRLRLARDRRSIAAIDVRRQVDLKFPWRGYNPLVDVQGLGCWPAEPDWSQLANGDAVKRHCAATGETLESFWCTWRGVEDLQLQAGQDFDHVVFAISLGAVPHLCQDIVSTNPRWAAMVSRVATVQTEAFQLWLRKPLHELGWPWRAPVLAGFVEPFDTWADMSHLVPREAWRQAEAPHTIAYFCNAMPGPEIAPGRHRTRFPQRQLAQVKADAVRFLRSEVVRLWPNAVNRYPDDFKWELLAGAGGWELDERRIETQFCSANVDPSDRYVQTIPGSSRFRIAPDATGYTNLTIAGDWTDCIYNAGCIEAAVASGMLASKAISGLPTAQQIVGYGHP